MKAISNLPDEAATRDGLRELVPRRLLQRSAHDPPRFDLHPIVRQYAYDRLADKQGVHTRLHDYFDAVPKPEEGAVKSLDDLQPVIELYHHTVRAGQFDEARNLYHDRLGLPLYYRFGAYLRCIELLSALFPDGQPFTPSGGAALPRLRNEDEQAWTLNELANSFSLSGQPRRAMLMHARNAGYDEEHGRKEHLATSLVNLAVQNMFLGSLAAAEENLRRSIALFHEIKAEVKEAIGHNELGRLLVHRVKRDAADKELAAAIAAFEKAGELQYQGVTWAYRALKALLMGDAREAAASARRARELADKTARRRYPHERDFVRAEWLLGWAKVALAEESAKEGRGASGRGVPAQRVGTRLLAEAEGHLTEALTRCRRINNVESEPSILLAWGRWHRAKGNREEARKHAEEALAIADRCEFRLCQADIHNFLAQLALDAGDKAAALRHAQIGRERAECDGKPHWYKPAVDEAERLLKEAEGGDR